MAVSPSGATAYTANDFTGTVSVIDTATNTVTATIPAGSFPTAVAVFTLPPPATPPVVTGISPASGPVTGGTSVTITGTRLTAATAVTFGTTPATTFIVRSDTQITATAPPPAPAP